MKKFIDYLRGWRGIALITYMWLAVMAWVIVYVDFTSPELKRRFYIISIAEVVLLAMIYICPRLLGWAERLNALPEPEELTKAQKRKIFFKSWLVSFSFFFVLYIIFYPGGLSPDNVSQYAQAIGYERYNDVHPVLHTLFAFNLPLKLTGGWIGSINLFQLTLFSLTLAYMALVLTDYGGRRFAKYSLAYILLNPLTIGLSITPQKDTAFTITALLLMLFTLRTYFTNGEWMKKISHAIIFLIVLTVGTVFRHNAILFTVPMLFTLSLFIRKRQALLMFICFVVMVYAIRHPLYRSMNVAPKNTNTEFLLSMPMTVIGNAVKESHEYLDEEVLDFAYSVAPQEIWDKNFDVYKSYASIRYGGGNAEAIEQAGIKKVLTLMLRCFKEAPYQSLRGLLAMTGWAYGFMGPPVQPISPVVFENNFGIENNKFFRLKFLEGIAKKIFPPTIRSIHVLIENDNFSLQTLIVIYTYIIAAMFKHVFTYVGVLNIAVMILILARMKFDKVSDWKKICFALPMLIHNYGTMLVLPSLESRYFYAAYPLFPLVVLILLSEHDG